LIEISRPAIFLSAQEIQKEKGKGLKEMANFTSFKDFKIQTWAGCYKHQPTLNLCSPFI
jgi:hypothetical protein